MNPKIFQTPANRIEAARFLLHISDRIDEKVLEMSEYMSYEGVGSVH